MDKDAPPRLIARRHGHRLAKGGTIIVEEDQSIETTLGSVRGMPVRQGLSAPTSVDQRGGDGAVSKTRDILSLRKKIRALKGICFYRARESREKPGRTP